MVDRSQKRHEYDSALPLVCLDCEATAFLPHDPFSASAPETHEVGAIHDTDNQVAYRLYCCRCNNRLGWWNGARWEADSEPEPESKPEPYPSLPSPPPLPQCVIDKKARETSRKETLEHIDRVRSYLLIMTSELIERGHRHDASKLKEPELSMFAEWGPKLKQMEYGSDQYKNALASMGGTLHHHYQHNPHHPEHYPDGIDGMNLIDLIEMVCDWKASVSRVKNGNLSESLGKNGIRFSISAQLLAVIKNTADLLEKNPVNLQW